MPIKVDMIEHLGADTLIHGRYADQNVTVLSNVVENIQIGDVIHTSIPKEHHHFFDKKSENRL